ncbi:hypothetical protein GR223_33970 [Rhizobium leguminosarum]|uniref:hypothetical protein n=1 Tax=Rhizobium ruizarguesonis TaxID=2081791 RepID=UPI0013E07462|nr:hypothetical protein [Rhizobium ruizarguesonis]NEJ90898.1 hypothetical protein [Rhizobium ruizarguesonis]
MTGFPSISSQRLLRKGPLVEETFRLFLGWDFDESVESNLIARLHGSFRTQGWEREVIATIGRRLKNFVLMEPLVVLARNGMGLADWRDCWRLWVGITEAPFGEFVRDWLCEEYIAGRYNVRSEDAREFASYAWAAHSHDGKVLSDYGLLRAARDLLKTAVDLGLLTGKGPAKTFSPAQMGDDALLFHIHLIAAVEGSYVKVPASVHWRLALMYPDDVHRTLLRLHQYRKVDYQVAGSFVQLTLPHSTPLAFAKALKP